MDDIKQISKAEFYAHILRCTHNFILRMRMEGWGKRCGQNACPADSMESEYLNALKEGERCINIVHGLSTADD